MSKQTFRLPTWRRKPTADETAPDIADSELVPAESAARPTRRKHGKRTYVIGDRGGDHHSRRSRRQR